MASKKLDKTPPAPLPESPKETGKNYIGPDVYRPGAGALECIVFQSKIPVSDTTQWEGAFYRDQGWTLEELEPGRLRLSHTERKIKPFEWVGAGYTLVRAVQEPSAAGLDVGNIPGNGQKVGNPQAKEETKKAGLFD